MTVGFTVNRPIVVDRLSVCLGEYIESKRTRTWHCGTSIPVNFRYASSLIPMTMREEYVRKKCERHVDHATHAAQKDPKYAVGYIKSITGEIREQYEARAYREALIAIEYAGQIRTLVDQDEFSAEILALMAMSHCRLGDQEETSAAFGRLIGLFKKVRLTEQDHGYLFVQREAKHFFSALQLLSRECPGMHLVTSAFDDRSPKTAAQKSENLFRALSRTLGEDHPLTLMCARNYAILQKRQRRYEEAEPHLLQVYYLRRRSLGERHAGTVGSARDLVGFYESWGRSEEAQKWRVKLSGHEAQTHVTRQEGQAEGDTVSKDAQLVRTTVATRLRKEPDEVVDRDYLELQQLDLSGSAVSDLGPLEKLVNLRLLLLGNTHASELEPLRELVNLRTLFLQDTHVGDLEPLKHLGGLQELRLSRTPVSNLRPLADLTRLRRLWADGTQVADIEPLEGLTNLELLDIGYTPVAHLEALRTLPRLKVIWLPATPVRSLEALKSCTSLERLYLWDTQVDDLKPLVRLTKLQTLDLSGTPVSDIGPLETLINLKSLKVSGTNVNKEQINELRKSLPGISIHF